MTWFKVDDGFWRHRKVRKLGRTRISVPAVVGAAGLWTLAGDYGADNTTDGFLTREEVEAWDPKHQLAARLIAVGLWHEIDAAGNLIAECSTCQRVQTTEPGYLFHQWEEHQPTREEVLDKRRKRQEAGRIGGARSAQTRRSKLEANASANGQPNAQAHANHVLEQDLKQKRTPSRPVPARPEDPAGDVGRGASGWQTSGEPPPPNCPKHRETPAQGPCGACADARRARERWDTDQAERRAQLAAELEKARADPRLRCHHGTDGGLHVRSDTGQSPCALCRAENLTGSPT